MPPNRIGKNRLDMSGGIRMPVCMKSPNILIVRQPPFAMRPNRCGWRAKKTAAYKGQDPAKVTHYLTRPAGFSDCQRVCPDETGFDRRLFRPYARSLKGQMAKARISGKDTGAYLWCPHKSATGRLLRWFVKIRWPGSF
ncbi:phage associated protein [Neisseria gonorrhoeae]|uniref:Phage associated protein n=1 Tax=Neisseria gonorrhoeae TaxID=485 RepID=A0A378W0F9_NEIGO|nr:phage associated protein [Neisseria gonorrhoeae]